MNRFYSKHYFYRLLVIWIALVSCVPSTQAAGTSQPVLAPEQTPAPSIPTASHPSQSTEPYPPVPGAFQVFLPTVVARNQLHFSNIGATHETIPIYEKFELTFYLDGSLASQPDFPFDPSPPPGLQGQTGVTVDALFLPPGENDWNKAKVQPAFRYQSFQRFVSGEAEGLSPVGDLTWMARFSPQIIGEWKYKLRAQDATICSPGVSPCQNWIESPVGSFTALAPTPGKHGFVRISPKDSRYFEFSDGTPFIGQGFQFSFGSNTQVESIFNTYQENGINFLRTWMSATGVYSLGFPFWDTWSNSNLVFTPVYPGNEVSAQIVNTGDSPCIFQGFGEGAKAFLKGGKVYKLDIRVRTENFQGPRISGKPFGLVAKFGTWPKGICGNPDNGLQTLSPYLDKSGDWTDLTGTFTLPNDVILGNGQFFTIALENMLDGQAYIDRVTVSDASGGPNVLIRGDMNYHLYFDQAASWRWDYILDRAAERNIFLKLVTLEKHDGILSYFRPDGTVAPEPDDNNFYGVNPANPSQVTKTRRLQEYFWRYLSARWGYSTAVHSWELLNEGDPFNGNHYDQAEDFSRTINATDPSQHLATTSFWHSFPVDEFWANQSYPDLDYADFHAYIATTWLKAPNDIQDPITKQTCGSDQTCYLTAMKNDTVLYHLEHSTNARLENPGKPVVRGEAGITALTSDSTPDPDLEKDILGTWLHKFLFAQMDPGGVYELYWYSDTIRANNLYAIYARYHDFMASIPINSGQFIDLAANSTNPLLRIVGQKDPGNNRAFMWIDNRQQTWRNVVDGLLIPAISGEIMITGFSPNIVLPVQWWNTCSGQPPSACNAHISNNNTVQTDNNGTITLQVQNLENDIAIKIGIFPTEK
jgi:hypothetical protein